MEGLGKILLLFAIPILLMGCKRESESTESTAAIGIEKPEKSVAEIKEALTQAGYKTFDFIDEKTKDTVLMQQYFIAFLKRGPDRSQSKEVTDSLQGLHLAHLGRMYKEGFADISGPFGDDGDIRGITIYNTPTLEIADSLANMDPMVKSGRLIIEMHPWWAAKGFPLR